MQLVPELEAGHNPPIIASISQKQAESLYAKTWKPKLAAMKTGVWASGLRRPTNEPGPARRNLGRHFPVASWRNSVTPCDPRLLPRAMQQYNVGMGLRFEWHEIKAAANLRKHRVGFDEAKTVFGDPLSLVIPDVAHSRTEDRWVRIGLSSRSRLLVVVYTERNEAIRLISSRRATIGEKACYEQANQYPERQ